MISYSSGGPLIIPLAWILTRVHVTVIVSGGFSGLTPRHPNAWGSILDY